MSARKKTLAIFALFCVSIFVFASPSGSGNSATENRHLSDVNEVELSVPAQVTVSHGVSNLKITADDNLLAVIKTKVKGSTLQITTNSDIHFKSPIKITISLPDIKRVAIHGTGSFDVIEVNNSNFEGSIYGSGKITASGKTQAAEFEIFGSGKINAEELHAQSAKVNIAGSGETLCGEVETLQSQIAGSGTVSYLGNPALESTVYGSGAVVARR
ncbi:putative autotransporter adhesin-like protein [Alteromonadaceae bacterium 2753L.S.0a.02]|nr:putative autotransporter adhesin-like protein [Alteromonadaceae bacterium 2753L.S.0a.02]